MNVTFAIQNEIIFNNNKDLFKKKVLIDMFLGRLTLIHFALNYLLN